MEETLFAKWSNWIATLDRLLNELIKHRYIYTEVREIVLSNSNVNKPNHFYNWLYYMHGIDMAVSVRKLTDPDPRTISVRSFLESIKRNHTFVSRTRYKERYLNEVYTEVEAERDLDKVLGPGNECIEIARIDEQIAELDTRTDRIKIYVDKVIAHLDRKAPSDIPQMREGDEAIDYMLGIIDLYYSYFQGIDPGDRQPNFSYDWKEIFRYAWLGESE